MGPNIATNPNNQKITLFMASSFSVSEPKPCALIIPTPALGTVGTFGRQPPSRAY